jgi:methyl-accepting chemotaxis protein
MMTESVLIAAIKHISSYIAAGLAALLGLVVWRYKKDVQAIDQVRDCVKDVAQEQHLVRHELNITKNDVHHLRASLLDRQDRLLHDIDDIKSSLKALNKRLDQIYQNK